MDKTALCVESYRRLKNLKAVGDETGIPWQTVYVHLQKAGEPVTGDKAVYGSATDRLAATAEGEFERLVPAATNNNRQRFQAPMDFTVYAFGVDVKASRLVNGHASGKYRRWTFSLKKQEMLADFIVCFGYHDDGKYETFLLPGQIIRRYTTVAIGLAGKCKWRAYQVKPESLAGFFADLQQARAA